MRTGRGRKSTWPGYFKRPVSPRRWRPHAGTVGFQDAFLAQGSREAPPRGEACRADPPMACVQCAGGLVLAAGATVHGDPPQSAAVIPCPSVIVKMRSSAGSFTVSFAPEGQ